MYKEYQPELTVTSVEIHFKLTLPSEELAYKLLKSLREQFTNAELLYKPKKELNELLYRFSVKVDSEFSYHNMEEFTKLIHIVTGNIFESITQKDPSIKLSRMLMWVKKIWLKIKAPPHFKEAILESLNETKWFITSIDESTIYDTYILKLEVWCDYQLFKQKPSSDMVLRSGEEISERDLYDTVADKEFLKDCMRFFTAFSENIKRKYSDILLI
ncbi:MAG: hypothetical protein J7K36_04825 [Archaeoglobaceae archaeon]|nr:hypothetical protein [Archaeoglobaceae archaeon]